MEHSSNGDPRGDIIARGIVSEEQARIMYERYASCSTDGSRPEIDIIIDSQAEARTSYLSSTLFVTPLTPYGHGHYFALQ